MDDINYQEKFVNYFKENIHREGADKLLEYILKSDFFTAPASTRFHSAFDGGLCKHSVLVYERFLSNVKREYGENWEDRVSAESVAIIGLLHDVCKIDYYKVEMRNVKVDGVWVQQPYYMVEDKLPYGHGEKSVYIINGFIRLTREESMAINWHMGAFDPRCQIFASTISDAFAKFPLALIFHISDTEASYLDER